MSEQTKNPEFDKPAEAARYLADKPISSEAILSGPRTAIQKNNIYRTARKQGIRIGFEDLENGDVLLTKTADLGEAYAEEIKLRDNRRRQSYSISKKPLAEGEHPNKVSDLTDQATGSYVDLFQNEKDIRRDAKKAGFKVRIEEHGRFRRVTKL